MRPCVRASRDGVRSDCGAGAAGSHRPTHVSHSPEHLRDTMAHTMITRSLKSARRSETPSEHATKRVHFHESTKPEAAPLAVPRSTFPATSEPEKTVISELSLTQMTYMKIHFKSDDNTTAILTVRADGRVMEPFAPENTVFDITDGVLVEIYNNMNQVAFLYDTWPPYILFGASVGYNPAFHRYTFTYRTTEAFGFAYMFDWYRTSVINFSHIVLRVFYNDVFGDRAEFHDVARAFRRDMTFRAPVFNIEAIESLRRRLASKELVVMNLKDLGIGFQYWDLVKLFEKISARPIRFEVSQTHVACA